MPKEFACPNCNCPSVVLPQIPDDHERVVCRACGTTLASMSQFRHMVEGLAPRSGTTTTGC
jgi:transcription elongation factor Elf1